MKDKENTMPKLVSDLNETLKIYQRWLNMNSIQIRYFFRDLKRVKASLFITQVVVMFCLGALISIFIKFY